MTLFQLLDGRELALVERTAAFSQRWRLTPLARVMTRLGNGWVYPIAALFLTGSLRCLVAAAASIAAAFAVYPLMKRSIARSRPSLQLADAPRPLDHYSFPSGHAMTLDHGQICFCVPSGKSAVALALSMRSNAPLL